MKKQLSLILMMLIASVTFSQIRLSQPITGQLQAIGIRQTESRISTAFYGCSSIYFSIDTIYNNSVSIYLNGSLSPIYSEASSTYYLNNVVATTPQSVATQLRAWGVAQASSGGGGGSANPYPGADYSKNAPLVSIDGKTPLLNGDGGSPSHIVNFPSTQPISGSVTVSTLPSIPTGTNTIGNVGVNGTVPVSMVSGSLPYVSNPTNSTVSVGTTSTTLIASDPTPYIYIIQNTSTATVSVWITNGTATVGNGIELPAGASYQSPYRVTGAITGIVTSGTQNVQIQKFQ